MSSEIQEYKDPGPMSVEKMKEQVNLIQHMLQEVMKKDVHYGLIPGCGDKPTLLKAGAEKICLTFRLSPTYAIESIDMEEGHREVEVICTLTHIPTGQVFGQGVGSCSTMEGKYRFRNAARKCPNCDAEAIIKGKEEFGGGWLCWTKRDGCGAKFEDRDPKIINQDAGQIEWDNPADYYNTVLKMAKKRAHVDAALTATAASDCFNQDIEDMPEVIPGAKEKQESKVITEDQRIRLRTIATKNKWPDSAVKSLIATHGYESSKFIEWQDYEKIVKELEMEFDIPM